MIRWNNNKRNIEILCIRSRSQTIFLLVLDYETLFFFSPSARTMLSFIVNSVNNYLLKATERERANITRSVFALFRFEKETKLPFRSFFLLRFELTIKKQIMIDWILSESKVKQESEKVISELFFQIRMLLFRSVVKSTFCLCVFSSLSLFSVLR